MVANTGHFNVEIDIPALQDMADGDAQGRATFVEEYMLDGRTAHLRRSPRAGWSTSAAAEGHPARVMDMSFANQALSAEYMVKHARRARAEGLRRARGDRSRDRPPQARGEGVEIDKLTEEQAKYLASWDRGT